MDFFEHSVTTARKPWSHLNFGDRHGGEDFCFGIISDRTGRPTPGVFEKGIATMNRMRPDFVMSVGDYIEGFCIEDFTAPFIEKQWDNVIGMIDKCIPPFFYVTGNHDYAYNLPSREVWLSRFGVTHYFFVYKNTLFICLNTSETADGIGKEQIDWTIGVLKKYTSVRWTFLFMHQPMAWLTEDFACLEEELYDRNYTVFAGDRHKYTKYVRNGRKYIMLGTTGGGDCRVGQGQRGVPFGEFDHVTWVSMAGNKPEITNIAISGIYDEDVVTTEKITWLTAEYFRANKKISPEKANELRDKGIFIEETIF